MILKKPSTVLLSLLIIGTFAYANTPKKEISSIVKYVKKNSLKKEQKN